MSDKKCKGQHKAHGFDGCGKLVLANTRRYGLCPKCFFSWMQETTQGKLHYRSQFLPRVKKVTDKAQKVKQAEAKDKLTDWPKKLVVKCQEIARLIDTGQPCLARGNHPRQMHGGHIFSKGSSPTMKYNLHNIHRQGAQSNHYQADDVLLRDGLIREYGQEYFERLQSMHQVPAIKLSPGEYKEAYRRACKVATGYRRAGKVFTAKQRIAERRKANIAIGIYSDEWA